MPARMRTCSMPFMAHHVQNQTRDVEKPKATLSTAVAIRPPASSMVGEVREPSTPDTNLLQGGEDQTTERGSGVTARIRRRARLLSQGIRSRGRLHVCICHVPDSMLTPHTAKPHATAGMSALHRPHLKP